MSLLFYCNFIVILVCIRNLEASFELPESICANETIELNAINTIDANKIDIKKDAKGTGKITHGKITNGYKKSGYYLETDDAVYKILGAPKLALGQITSPIYITSKGETEWIWITSAANDKKTWMGAPKGEWKSSKKGLIVHYNSMCIK